MPMSTTKDLVDQVKLNRVVELIVSGEASTVKAACKLAGVPTSTFYAIQKRGLIDEAIAQALQQLRDDIALIWATKLPSLAESLVALAEDKDTSSREKINAIRALLQFDKVIGTAPIAPSGESAADWLKRQGARYQPVQINVEGDLVVSGPPPDEGVIEGEAEELEKG